MPIRITSKRKYMSRKDLPTRAAPIPEEAKEQVKIPQDPHYDPHDPEERHLYDEQQVARVELMMLKGFRDPLQLMYALSIDSRAAIDRYMQRVVARWEVLGAGTHMQRYRGQALQSLGLAEATLWGEINDDTDTKTKNAVMRTLLAVTREKNMLLGLTPKAVERLMNRQGDSDGFNFSVGAHDRMGLFMRGMLGAIEKRMKLIDARPEEDKA